MKIFNVLTLLATLGFAMPQLAQADANLLGTNDLTAASSTSYSVSGPDPYLVFIAQASTREPKFLLLDIELSSSNVPMELFFRSQQQIFDPWYKLSFVASTSKVALLLPDDIALSTQAPLRLDVNDCTKCQITINSRPRFSNSDGGLTIVKARRVFNGIAAVNDTGITVDLNGWHLNALEGSINKFEISENDPFLVSPDVNVGTQNLAAIHVKLTAPITTEIASDYQLFYATENHGFVEHASTIVRIPETDSTSKEFVVPLEFLSRELPADSMLTRIRLDLPLIAGNWSLESLQLLSFMQMDDYRGLVPEQLINNKRQRSTGLALIKKAVLNVFSDLGFILAYLALIFITGIGFWRAYRK